MQVKAWLVYTLARLGIFAAAVLLLLLTGLPWYWATIGGAVVGLLVSYLALPRLRNAVTMTIAERRARPERDADSDFEDDFVDAADVHDAPAPSTTTVAGPSAADDAADRPERPEQR